MSFRHRVIILIALLNKQWEYYPKAICHCRQWNNQTSIGQFVRNLYALLIEAIESLDQITKSRHDTECGDNRERNDDEYRIEMQKSLTFR